MKKIISTLLLIYIALSSIVAGGSKEKSTEQLPQTIRVAALVGPSGVGMAYLFSNKPALSGNVTAIFEAAPSADIVIPKLLTGELDIAILPPNVAAKVYNASQGKIIVGAVVGKGMLSLISTDSNTTTLEALQGKTVYVAGQGATPEYVLRALIKKSGIPEDSITLNFSIPTQEIASALISGKISYAIVPEPFATVAVMNGRALQNPVAKTLDISKEWENLGFGNNFPMTVCVIRKEFAEKNPKVVEEFLEAYKYSIDITVSNPSETAKLVELHNLGLKAAIAEKAIPSSQYTFVLAKESRIEIEKLLSVFLEYAPESIGGKLPDDGFYF